MKILVTGTEGYIGSLLVPQLLARGHEVTGVDTGFYEDGHLYHAGGDRPKTLVRDIRHLDRDHIAGHDAVVHLAELSNDPTGELAPHITHQINHRGSVRLAQLAKEAGAGRFIYMSSCSVYGVAGDDAPVDETTPVNPQTAYALCKTLCERDILPLADRAFSPVVFRNATAFGASPRQRFDLVVNNLCGLAWTTRGIRMNGDGSPWRPLVHALDIGKAVCCALEAPREAIHAEVFNIGSNERNLRVREVAEIVARYFPGCELSLGKPGNDHRSYRVRFDKITRHLQEFQCDWSVERGVRQLHALFRRIELGTRDFEFRAYTRLKQLQHLIHTGQIDTDFFWSAACETQATE